MIYKFEVYFLYLQFEVYFLYLQFEVQDTKSYTERYGCKKVNSKSKIKNNEYISDNADLRDDLFE